ncbi:hypothetical protein MPPM_2812 [Methylorubrum populi]|uniref:Uncharacterized protein n=1 Tax=Methylorubrum populi TaxID=223967 RepID=A0A160PE64_9HYPH|nr:hypothetical protein MPPM_2812 [Methylorubrum populi]
MTEVDRTAAALTFERDDEDELLACGVGPRIAVAIVNASKTSAGLGRLDNVRHGTGEPRRLLPRAPGAAPPSVSSS